jgi:hypothetical protein
MTAMISMDDVKEATSLVRHFLKMPSMLTASKMRGLSERAVDAISQAEYLLGYFAGELSATDDDMKELSKVSYPYWASKILAPLAIVLIELKKHALPPKRPRAGRPEGKKELDGRYAFVIAGRAPGQSLLEAIREAADKGLIDKKVKDVTHLRRIERFLDAARKHAAASKIIPSPGGRGPNKNRK